MRKRLIIVFFFYPALIFAQFNNDFEAGTIANWTESTVGRWAASDILPLNGSYSLHHIFDNPDAGDDQVSVSLPSIDLSAATIKWKFKIKYDYNPSDGNNWVIFLASDVDANQMFPGGAVNGYALAVNFTGSDDILKLLKVTSGSAETVITSSLNWDTYTDPSDIIAIEITRSEIGEWEVSYNLNGDFDSLTSIGTGSDNTYITAGYFGVYYDYTSSADRKLWIDDIYIGPGITDNIPPETDSLYVISYKNLKVEFNEKVDSVIAVNSLNYNVNGGIGNPDSVYVDGSNKYAELFFNQKFADSQLYEINIQNIEDLNGNVISDTTINFTYEYIKPISVGVISSSEIQVQFSRNVDTSSAENALNYTLDNGTGNPILAQIVNGDTTKVQLSFDTDLTNATNYELSLQNIADQNLDSLQSEKISFLYFVPEQFNIVINEIMADPYPELNLPNYEYLEIKNTTGFDIDLTGWKLKSGSTEREFPDSTIQSNSYMILCDNDASEYLDDYGSACVFPSFPSITNSGTTISIFDGNDNFIDSVRFTLDWYNDPDKETGGWSLERIDPLNTCSGITNWKASEDSNGGTPGKVNSVHASNIDTQVPGIEEVVIVSSNQLKIKFNEPVTKESLLEKTNYSVDNEIGNPSTIEYNTSQTEVDLTFLNSFTNEFTHVITIVNLEDYCGNAMSPTSINFTYYEIKPFDIVVNEIMALPYPEVNLPNYEYLEIKNTTEFDIDLTGWKLKLGSSEREFPDSIIESNSYLILCDNDASEYLDDYGSACVFPSFPSITNSGTTISIYDGNDNFIDSVRFTLDWYNDPVKESGGWSLERIDPLNTCSGITNWKASEDSNGGTPGTVNSVYASNIDTQAPGIDELVILSSNQLKIKFNEPVTKESLLEKTNYSVDNEIGNPSTIEYDTNQTEVYLTFLNSFTDEFTHVITVVNLEDYCGNAMSPTSINFIYYEIKPYDIVVNEIMALPYPEVNLPNYEYLEIKNTTEFDIDLTGWKLKSGSSEREFPDSIIESNSYLVLCDNDASEYLDDYGSVCVFPSFPSITNSGTTISIFDENNNFIDSVQFTLDWYNDPVKESGGWSLERIDPLNTCSGITNWKASEDSNGGTPGTVNSVYASNIDTQAPGIEEVVIVSSNQLKIKFNEPVTKESLLEKTNYSVDNEIGNPSTIEYNTSQTEVYLTFLNSFTDEFTHVITVVNLQDYCGNAMLSTNINFTYYEIKPFDIVVNEIMALPYPEVNLPNYEYLEIKNTTEFDIDLTGWKLKSGSSEREFPNSIIESNSYQILCDNDASEYLDDYGSACVFPSFPSITNSGTTISIFDENDDFIDSVQFTLDWYNDPDKETGGWSLERIDPLNTCSGITNWKASEDPNGGTPGKVNSVHASNIDTQAPGIEEVVIVSSNQLKIKFNEPVTKESLLEKTNYSVDNGMGNPFSVIASSDLQEVDIFFANTFQEKITLTISIENLTDECGNSMILTEIDFVYTVAKPNDIVFNEIMIDPEPSMALPEYEYIELYNTSDFNINLLDWTLTVGSTIKTLAPVIINSGQYLILCSNDAATELQAFGDVHIVSGFPGLSNTEQTLVLQNPKKEIISQISYSKEWYQDDYKAEGGWSLEQIDPLNPCGGANNWIASNSETGGTPGQENSVKASNPDLDAPSLLRIGVIDDQHIQLFFSETLDSLTAMQTNIYKVDQDIGNPISVDLIEFDYKSLILEFDEEFDISTIYTLEITGGIYDCAGNEIYDKNWARFSIPVQVQENDLIINEVLFNPLAGGYDFVEIYNRSEKTIDLQEILIAAYDDDELDYTSIEEITNEAFLIFPGDYIVLTENPVVVQNQYMTYNTEGFIKLKNLPSFNDDMGRVMLLDKWQNRIENFGYHEDMHFSLLATNEGVSLERINFNRSVDDKTNWHSASELAGFATPAYENSQFMELEDIEDNINIEPETFSPDNDGFDDFTNITFTFDEPGYVANIKIYDSKGRLIRYLANNMLLGIDGVITWDGLDEKNQKAPVGIYVVYIELFDLDGNVKQYKKSVVLAAMW